MKTSSRLLAVAGSLLAAAAALYGASDAPRAGVSVPFTLDHNRMLVAAEVQAKDGTWRPARLWVDSGNPQFILSQELAGSLGFERTPVDPATPNGPASLPPLAVRIGGVPVDFAGLTPRVAPGAQAFWPIIGADGNLPSTVLSRYRVILDYPKRRFALAAAASMGGTGDPSAHRGVRVPARVNRQTGIAQLEAVVAGEPLGLAIDMGASYTFVSADRLASLASRHPDWPRTEGAVGCANIWGVLPKEESWAVVRLPELRLGTVTIAGVGVVGAPAIFGNDPDLGTWYSRKTAAPVAGFLGPNAFKGLRLEIDYAEEAVYLERGGQDDVSDMDLIALTLQPDGGRWRVLGGRVEGVEAGDVLLEVNGVQASGATMGTVVDALRGKPGEERTLTIERQGKRLQVTARVRRVL